MRQLALASLVALAVPAHAAAHATLVSATPDFRERAKARPRAVTLHFDQAVSSGAVDVRDERGRGIALRTRTRQRTVVAPLRRVERAAYTVRWHALSSDGHVVAGVYTFGFGVAAPPPTEAFGASGPTRAEHVIRWAYFVSLALLLGGLAFRLLVARGPLPPAAERRFYVVTGVGAVATLELGITAFVLRAQDALQLPVADLLYANLTPIANGTRFGTAFIAMTLGYALVAALLFLAWLTDRRALLWPALLVGLGFASGLSVAGHAGDDGALAALADWIHLTAAMLWVGGLVCLVTVELGRRNFVAFSRLATALVAVLVAAGIYLSVLRLPAVDDLWTSGYGRILLVKLALVGLALLWGAMHHFVVRPRLAAIAPGRLTQSLVGESTIGMAVLLVSAVLVDAQPPG